MRRGRRGSAAGRDRAGAGRRAPGRASRRLGAGLLSPTDLARSLGGATVRGRSRGPRRGLLAGIADQQRPDAAALAQLDLVGGSSPKGSIRRRPSGARTPPSASPSTPHLGAECGRGRPRTKSSSAETGAELTSRLGANRRKGPDIRRVPARDSWLVVRMRTGRPRTRSGRGRPRAHSLFAVDRCQCLWGFRVSRWDAARGGHLAPLDAAPGPSNVAPFPLLFAADVVRANPLLLLGFPDWDKFALSSWRWRWTRAPRSA